MRSAFLVLALLLASCGGDTETTPPWVVGSWEPDGVAMQARTHRPEEERVSEGGLAGTSPSRFTLRADGTGTVSGPAFGVAGKAVGIRWVVEGRTIKVTPAESHAGPLDLVMDPGAASLSYRVPLVERVLLLKRAAEDTPREAVASSPVPIGAPAAPAGSALWTPVTTVDDLKERLAQARRDGKPVVARVWAAWCVYCTGYDELIKRDEEVRQALQAVVRLEIDVTYERRSDLRGFLGMPLQQPYIVFVSRDGTVLRDLDIGSVGRRDELLRNLHAVLR